MIRVWSDGMRAGVLDRLDRRGSTFAYDPVAPSERAVSVTMPVRVASWDTRYGLAPVFEMNLPEGALRERLTKRFAKATGAFDDMDLLAVVGRTQIGRIRYSGMQETMTEDVPFQSIDEILRARRDGGLFDYLLDRFAEHSGISGVQPKVMIRAVSEKSPHTSGRQSPSIVSATHIVKMWDDEEFPELAANEHFCMTAAKRLGLPVPTFQLSDDGDALVIERFDLVDGRYLGFEDFCVLNGFSSAQKYQGGYETRLFKRCRDFLAPEDASKALETLFRVFVLNCAIRNGDAHLKNFGILYEGVNLPPRLAPIFDLVTTSAYIPDDAMALSLDGSTHWPDRKRLERLGATRADLGLRLIHEIFESTADAVSATASSVRRHFTADKRDIGLRITCAWDAGIRDSLGAVVGVKSPRPPSKRRRR